MKNYKFLLVSLCLLLLIFTLPVYAQTDDLPIYIVQPGDTMYGIAIQFGVTVDDIIAANTLINPDWLAEGDQIRIPGYEGIGGIFMPYTIQITDTFDSLLNQYKIDQSTFVNINRITSPNEIIAGNRIILPVTDEEIEQINNPQQNSFHSPLLTLMESGAEIWAGELHQISSIQTSPPNNLTIADLSIDPFPLQQGKTSVIQFSTENNLLLQMQFESQLLPIFEYEPGEYIGFLAINALDKTGLKEMQLQYLNENDNRTIFSQNLLANETIFPTDPIIIVEPELINPEKTLPEEEELFVLASQITNRDLWDGSFSYPVDDACIRSPYGSTRSYNNGPYDAFHTGIDFGTCAANLNIYAAGSGRVVYADEWFVRGNSVVIDHGWGIYTGYWHQENVLVKVGDIVEEGQIIGTVGTTGRSTGYHLHWELLVNGVQVDPMQWMQMAVP
jgi:murein DD-endopeptidase MepM/ murein hydrolase activator NlpD